MVDRSVGRRWHRSDDLRFPFRATQNFIPKSFVEPDSCHGTVHDRWGWWRYSHVVHGGPCGGSSFGIGWPPFIRRLEDTSSGIESRIPSRMCDEIDVLKTIPEDARCSVVADRHSTSW